MLHTLCAILNSRHNFSFFFFNDTATTEIYTLSLHDALPICNGINREARSSRWSSSGAWRRPGTRIAWRLDRKSTRLNSSHSQISYAVFCLKKKKRYTRCEELSTLSAAPSCHYVIICPLVPGH